jgi:predicted MFS family arabinose efflux permease
LIRTPEPARPPRPEGSNALREIADGVGTVIKQPVLLSMLVTMGVLIVAAHAVQPVAVIFAYRTLHLSPATLGVAFSVEGAGSLLGAAMAAASVARLGAGRVMVLTSVGSGLGLAGIPLALYMQPAVVFSAALFVLGLTGTLQNVVQLSLRQALTPDSHQARMTATFRTVYWGAWPLGNLIGGAAGAAFGAVPVIVVAAVLVVLAGAAMAFTPLAKVKEAAV